MNASLAGLIVATGGVAVARLVDGQVLAIMLLAVAVTAVGVAAMLGISYAVFRRGERDNTSEPTL
ncbi:Putative membrane protein [Corynebacterium glyciniphilum AJ 3170]|uniref:Putative membrane protein n=1 Tax=Corynebacterium glyciniphilum AJ 3170 TaxID=1404245 RepID=X5ECI1_9CORY|nr:Putative membrane protein [Corynebacterium glyciniphilum AJ 3170]